MDMLSVFLEYWFGFICFSACIAIIVGTMALFLFLAERYGGLYDE